MRLDAVINQAASGLQAATRQLGLVGQNVANANTAGYTRQTAALSSASAGDDGNGVRSGIVTRALDPALGNILAADLRTARTTAAEDQLRSTTLAAVDAASGAPGAGTDIATLLGNLRDSVSTLAADPANQTQQRAAVSAADTLARGINGLATAITAARQSTQDGMVEDVAKANTALHDVGALSDAVIAARARGESTADLEDRRDAAMGTVATLTGARFLSQANGDVLAFSGGTNLPTRSATGPFALAAATVGPGSAAPPLLLSGSPAALAGGTIAAAAALRDQTLPGLSANLDTFAQTLAAGFSAAGLTLFAASDGTAPASTTGFATTVAVSPAVAANPAAMRDGTTSPATTAGNTTLLRSLLNTVLATGPGTVAASATGIVADHATRAAAAKSGLETGTALQATLAAKLSAAGGVTVDTELTSMIQLQTSYGANAKVLSAVQAMFSQLMETVR